LSPNDNLLTLVKCLRHVTAVAVRFHAVENL